MTAPLTAADLARLRVPLSALPGLDDRWQPVWPASVDGIGRHVSLVESATADRVARWLAARVGLEVGCTAPEWRWRAGVRAWGLIAAFSGRYFVETRRQVWGRDDVVVPTLDVADLDPADTRKLSDGSRFVDRLALAIVAVHVGGAR